MSDMCTCKHLRPYQYPPFGGVVRDPKCSVHGDSLLKEKRAEHQPQNDRERLNKVLQGCCE